MLRRRLMQSRNIPEGAVDLGLPSGTLWARGNLAGNEISDETNSGLYYTWGNLQGQYGGLSQQIYNQSKGASLTSDIASNDASHDAALAGLGSPWRLPTRSNINELINHTYSDWTTIDGIPGIRFMSNADRSVYIFLPAAGHFNEQQYNDDEGTVCYFWSSSYYNSYAAYSLKSEKTDDYSFQLGIKVVTRYCGLPIRPVCNP